MIRRIQLNPYGEDLGGALVYARQRSESEESEHRRARLKRAMLQVVNGELTDRQRQMLTLYYFEGKTMIHIAAELGINKSTVSRTVKRAEGNIRRYLQYWV